MGINFKVKVAPAPVAAPQPAPVATPTPTPTPAPQAPVEPVQSVAPPWDGAQPVAETPDTKEESIFQALEALYNGRKGTLMLVHRENGTTLKVTGYDPATKQTRLTDSNNLKIAPKLTEREGKLYRPMWR